MYILDENDTLDDAFDHIAAYLVCIAAVCLVGVFGCKFFVTIWIYNVPLWVTLKCYLMLLAGEVCVSLLIVEFTAIINNLVLQQSPKSVRMLFPLCITVIPLYFDLCISYLEIEGFYIFFFYDCRYAVLGIILIMIILLFGKIGPYEGLLCCRENDNTQESLEC